MYSFGFSPFTDSSGKMKNIFEITYNDLNQLKEKDIVEGVKIEYKRELSSELKKKFPKFITSFANERGGWFFIGIDQTGQTICPIPKADYDEMVNNQLREFVTPMPRIQVRFLVDKSSDQQGVLVIWIPEGRTPPYIAKGNVFVRKGSNSFPLKAGEDGFTAIEDRYHLDKLYAKSENNKSKLNDFCEKKISIYNRKYNSFNKEYVDYGMCNIYLMPAYFSNLLEVKSAEDLKTFLIDESLKVRVYTHDSGTISLNMPMYNGMFSDKSLILRNAQSIDFFENTTGWEQYYDGYAKFHIPFKYIDRKEIIDTLKENAKNYSDSKVFEEFYYVDGRILFFSIFACLGLYMHSMKQLIKNFDEVTIVIELENVRKDSLYFNTDSYRKFLNTNGLVFSDKGYYKINEDFIAHKVDEKDLIEYLVQLMPVCNAFGFSVRDILKIIGEIEN